VKRSWWRRNIWALVALPVLVAGLGAPDVEDLYYRYLGDQPTQATVGVTHQTVQFHEAAITLVGVKAVTPTPEFETDPITPPAGYTFYEVDLSFNFAHDPTGLGACKIVLIDQSGRQYADSPDELEHAGVTSGSCEDFDHEAAKFDSAVYFRLPADAHPAAVTIVDEVLLPHYVRFLIT
jgi:hypothetical protein